MAAGEKAGRHEPKLQRLSIASDCDQQLPTTLGRKRSGRAHQLVERLPKYKESLRKATAEEQGKLNESSIKATAEEQGKLKESDCRRTRKECH